MNRDPDQRRPRPLPGAGGDRDRSRTRRDLGEIVTDSIGTLVEYLHLRGLLVRLEAREAGAELGKKAALLALAGLFFAIGYFGLVVALIAWSVEATGWSWPTSIAIAGGLHLVVALAAFLISRRHPRQPLFRDTLEELDKDRQWLSHKNKPRE